MTTLIQPITGLQDLRLAVVVKNVDRPKPRFPKWKFKIAEDLVIQLQPQKGEQRWPLFAGVSLEGAIPKHAFGMTIGDLERLDLIGTRFELYDRSWHGLFADGMWRFQATRGIIRRGADLEEWTRYTNHRDRVLGVLAGGLFTRLTPALMFAPACLLCGKELTDPASIARWIGPECAETSSLDAGLYAFLGGTPERVSERGW